MKTIYQGIAAVPVAVIGLALMSAPAHAESSSGFGISTTAVGADGYATATGTITFVDRNTVRVTSQVGDWCGRGSGDGEGAYLWLTINYNNGTYDRKLSLNWDNDGCSNGGRGSQTISFDPGVDIKRVQIRLDEAAGPSNPSETVYSTWRDNPYT